MKSSLKTLKFIQVNIKQPKEKSKYTQIQIKARDNYTSLLFIFFSITKAIQTLFQLDNISYITFLSICYDL